MTERQHMKMLNDKAKKAIRKAVSKALLEHEKAGVPAVIWKNGKVVTINSVKKKK